MCVCSRLWKNRNTPLKIDTLPLSHWPQCQKASKPATISEVFRARVLRFSLQNCALLSWNLSDLSRFLDVSHVQYPVKPVSCLALFSGQQCGPITALLWRALVEADTLQPYRVTWLEGVRGFGGRPCFRFAFLCRLCYTKRTSLYGTHELGIVYCQTSRLGGKTRRGTTIPALLRLVTESSRTAARAWHQWLELSLSCKN